MQQQIRILQVVGRAMNQGGAETLLMHFLRNIDRERFHMDFVVHSPAPGAYDDEARNLGSAVIPCLGSARPWVYARNFRRILRRHGPYDIVHAHVHWFSGLPLCLGALTGVRGRIANPYALADLEAPTVSRMLYRWVATRLIARYATIILASSQGTLDAFRRICDFRQPASVLYPGIDLAPFSQTIDRTATRISLQLPVDKPVITYVARFFPHKNHAQLVRIADRLNKDGYRFHFAMAGSHGPLLPAMREISMARPDISLHTGLTDLSPLLLASDLFFFPSIEEGFGMVAVEAAAAGLPVVATDLPPIREACAPSHRAYMFHPNDDAAAAAGILTILADPALQAHLAADAKEWATNFSITNVVAKLESIYSAYGPKPLRQQTAHVEITRN